VIADVQRIGVPADASPRLAELGSENLTRTGGKVLVVSDDQPDPGRWPRLASPRTVAANPATFDDLEPNPVTGMQGYAESFGDLGQGADDARTQHDPPREADDIGDGPGQLADRHIDPHTDVDGLRFVVHVEQVDDGAAEIVDVRELPAGEPDPHSTTSSRRQRRRQRRRRFTVAPATHHGAPGTAGAHTSSPATCGDLAAGVTRRHHADSGDAAATRSSVTSS
jgi:hypothetical protein